MGKYLSILFLIIVITSFSNLVKGSCIDQFYNGEFFINESVECFNETIEVNATIYIINNVEMNLTNTSLISINSTAVLMSEGLIIMDKSYINLSLIQVRDAVVIKSIISSNMRGRNSDLRITDSKISANNIDIESIYTSIINSNISCKNTCDSFKMSGKDIFLENLTINGFPSSIILNGTNDVSMKNLTVINSSIGIYLKKVNNVSIINSEINTSSISIVMESSENVNIENTSFSNMTVFWKLSMIVYGNQNPVENAVVDIYDTFSNSIFSGNTGSDGRISVLLLESFTNSTDTIIYNPYTINVEHENFKVNTSTINITSDTELTIFLEGEENISIPLFLSIESPVLNKTYFRGDLINGSLFISVNSNVDMESCTGTIESFTFTLQNSTGKNFFSYFNVTEYMIEGETSLIVECTSIDGETNSSFTWFLVFPRYDCVEDSNCLPTEVCEAYTCVTIDCVCGYIENHKCITYECCTDDMCDDDETCDINSHQCIPVSCECGIVENHQCVKPPNYCCTDNDCKPNEVCREHACIEHYLIINVSGTFIEGKKIIVFVKDNFGDVIDNAKVKVVYDDDEFEIFYTDENGIAEIELKKAGKTRIVVSKGNFAMKQHTIDVEASFNPFIIIIPAIVIPIFLLLFLRFHRNVGELALEKHIEGNRIMLKIKNRTKNVLKNITVIDSVPRGTFLGATIMPFIEQGSGGIDYLIWEIIEIEPKEEVVIEYQASAYIQGFIAKLGDKEFSG